MNTILLTCLTLLMHSMHWSPLRHVSLPISQKKIPISTFVLYFPSSAFVHPSSRKCQLTLFFLTLLILVVSRNIFGSMEEDFPRFFFPTPTLMLHFFLQLFLFRLLSYRCCQKMSTWKRRKFFFLLNALSCISMSSSFHIPSRILLLRVYATSD